MEKYNYAFLILHYLTIDDTKKCVSSILQKYLYNDNVQIVIVDNASNNGSGKILEEFYKPNKNVKVLFSNTNLGFANGNNIGFIYAKKDLKADFIIMINNDTVITQDDFLEKLTSEYKENEYAVLGPKIKLKDGKYNTIYKELQTIEHYKKDLRILKYEYFLNYVYLYPIYKAIRHGLRKCFIKLGLKKDSKKYDCNSKYENIILSGCALIFSKKYIDLFDGIDARTFLYREEEFLYLRLRKNNLKNIYSPNLEIYHDEDSSTNASTKSKRKKRLFVGNYMIESTEMLIKELEREQ